MVHRLPISARTADGHIALVWSVCSRWTFSTSLQRHGDVCIALSIFMKGSARQATSAKPRLRIWKPRNDQQSCGTRHTIEQSLRHKTPHRQASPSLVRASQPYHASKAMKLQRPSVNKDALTKCHASDSPAGRPTDLPTDRRAGVRGREASLTTQRRSTFSWRETRVAPEWPWPWCRPCAAMAAHEPNSSSFSRAAEQSSSVWRAPGIAAGRPTTGPLQPAAAAPARRIAIAITTEFRCPAPRSIPIVTAPCL